MSDSKLDSEDFGTKINNLPFSKEKIESEQKYNQKIFGESFFLLQQKYPGAFEALSRASPSGAITALSHSRTKSMLRAITHDLLRYAEYQRVDFVTETNRYAICPSIRASVFTKWITMLRPYMLDAVTSSSDSPHKWLANHCNEMGAISAASVAMSYITGRKTVDKTAPFLSDILNQTELEIFIYHLRYRVKHQDTYSLFYRRIKEQYV